MENFIFTFFTFIFALINRTKQEFYVYINYWNYMDIIEIVINKLTQLINRNPCISRM